LSAGVHTVRATRRLVSVLVVVLVLAGIGYSVVRYRPGTAGREADDSLMPTRTTPETAAARSPGVATGPPAGRSVTRPRVAASPRSSAPNVLMTARPTAVTVVDSRGRVLVSAPVDPMQALINPDGSWGRMNPPSLSRAVWETQSAAPGNPSAGTTALYGHACLGAACAFNGVAKVAADSVVILRTGRGVLRYRVTALQRYPKTGPDSLASKISRPNELMLVTCAYEPDSSSLDNLVLTATFVSATPT